VFCAVQSGDYSAAFLKGIIPLRGALVTAVLNIGKQFAFLISNTIDRKDFFIHADGQDEYRHWMEVLNAAASPSGVVAPITVPMLDPSAYSKPDPYPPVSFGGFAAPSYPPPASFAPQRPPPFNPAAVDVTAHHMALAPSAPDHFDMFDAQQAPAVYAVQATPVMYSVRPARRACVI
jgi:hypothetical protein